MPGLPYGGSLTGYTYPTPVTDGKNIYFKNGGGYAASLDLDGHIRWVTPIPHTDDTYRYGWFSSPVLLDGKLIFEMPEYIDDGAYNDSGLVRMYALDGETGEIAWQIGPYYSPMPVGSPVPMRLHNGDRYLDIIVGSGGFAAHFNEDSPDDTFASGCSIVRARDGKMIAANTGAFSGFATPVPVGDVVYHFGPLQATATRLILLDDDTVGAQRLWSRPCTDYDGGLCYRAGYLYGQEGGQTPQDYSVFEGATGAQITRQVNLGTDLYGPGRPYTPPVLAGNYIFVTDNGTRFFGYPRYAKMTVIQAGPQGRFIAKNLLWPSVSPMPLFKDDEMYIRGASYMACIGRTGKEGEAYEAQENARQLMSDLHLDPMPRVDATPIAPSTNTLSRASTLLDNTPLAKVPWCFIPPFIGPDKDQLAKALGPVPQLDFARNRTPDGPAIKTADNFVFPHALKSINDAPAINLYFDNGVATNAILYATLNLENPRARTLRVWMEQKNIRLWLEGTELQHQQRYTLAPGNYTLVVEGRTGDTPPAEFLMQLFFLPSDDLDAEFAFWRDSIVNNKAYLNRVIELCPETDTATLAKRYLDKIK
jgi:hypothetical protein